MIHQHGNTSKFKDNLDYVIKRNPDYVIKQSCRIGGIRRFKGTRLPPSNSATRAGLQGAILAPIHQRNFLNLAPTFG